MSYHIACRRHVGRTTAREMAAIYSGHAAHLEGDPRDARELREGARQS
jgi:hypothetical protein